MGKIIIYWQNHMSVLCTSTGRVNTEFRPSVLQLTMSYTLSNHLHCWQRRILCPSICIVDNNHLHCWQQLFSLLTTPYTLSNYVHCWQQLFALLTTFTCIVDNAVHSLQSFALLTTIILIADSAVHSVQSFALLTTPYSLSNHLHCWQRRILCPIICIVDNAVFSIQSSVQPFAALCDRLIDYGRRAINTRPASTRWLHPRPHVRSFPVNKSRYRRQESTQSTNIQFAVQTNHL